MFKHIGNIIRQRSIMGIKGLYTYITKHCTESGNGIKRPLSYFQNKTIMIDVSIYMYKFKHTNSIISLFDDLIQHLLHFNIKVILVFDGVEPITTIKKDEINTRKKQKETNAERIVAIENELNSIRKLMALNDNKEQIKELLIREKVLLCETERLTKTITFVSQTERNELYRHLEKTYHEKVDFIYGTTDEADKMIAGIAREGRGKVIVMSDDTDMFLHGCCVVAMNYDPETKRVNVYNLRSILCSLEMNLMEFIQVCIVVGTDYLSPYHENSPLPKVSITQMFNKFRRFREQLHKNHKFNNRIKDNHCQKYDASEITKPVYTNFIDFMCFIYWRNSKHDQTKLNIKLWSIFELFYKT